MSTSDAITGASTAGSDGTITATVALLRDLDQPLAIESVQLTDLAEGEVLVRMRGVGICHTDISAAHGVIPVPLPAVLGHEGSGVIERVGPGVDRLAVGDHVVLSFDHCGECAQCTGGHPAYCELFGPMNYFGERMDGTVTLRQNDAEVHGSWFGQSSFGTYGIASQHNAVKVADELPLELLGPLGCGLMTGAGSVLNVMQPKPGEGLIVFGLGAVGLGAVMAAKAAGCDPIIGVDLNPRRLEIASDLGATHGINPAETDDLLWRVQELAAPGLHYSFDAVGLGSVVRQALESLRSPGHCVTVGFQGLENEIVIDQGHILLGRRLSGVVIGDADPHAFIPRLLEMYRNGDFPFDRLVKTFPLAEINDAIAAAESGDVIKPVILFD
jgi:aryl-alcohol dehydrogenase